MSNRFSRYNEVLKEDAEMFLDEYYEDLIEDLRYGKVFDYLDWIDDGSNRIIKFIKGDLTLEESISIIENCFEEEDDCDLWLGLRPKDAIPTMAFHSYRRDLEFNLIPQLLKERLISLETDLRNRLTELEDIEFVSEENLDYYKKQLEVLERDKKELEDYIKNTDLPYAITRYGERLEDVEDGLFNINYCYEIEEIKLEEIQDQINEITGYIENVEEFISDLNNHLLH